MIKPKSVNKFETYLAKYPNWQTELPLLRKIILSTGLTESFKWGVPVFANSSNKNIVGFGGFKNYIGIWFFQGGLLKDKVGKLVNAQEGKTQAMRQWRFTELATIKKEEKLIVQYINESISNFELEKKIVPRKKKPLIIPIEMQAFLANDQAVNEKFSNMSLSYKREYAEYIIEAKKPETKSKRLEKIKDLILESKGLHDKYK